jgi:hypothetical protein
VATGVLVAAGVRRRRRRPAGWVEKVTAELERRGAAAGLKRLPTETLGEYASRLGNLGSWRAGPAATASLPAATAVLERAAYGFHVPDAPTRAFVEEVVNGLHPARGSRRPPRGRRLTPA